MRFPDLLQYHLDILEWSPDHLANACDVSRAKVQHWLERKPEFPPTIGEISRITGGLIFGYDQRGGPKGLEDLAEVLVDLLAAANYRIEQIGGAREIVGQRILEMEELRVAFPNWPPLIYTTSSAEVHGPLAVLTRWIGKLSGKKVKFIRKDWSALGPALRNNEADLTAPIVNTPGRSEFGFSVDIPGLQIGISGLTATGEVAPDRGLLLSFLKGEVGALVGHFVFLTSTVEDRPPFETIAEAIEFIRANPVRRETGEVRTLVLDSEMCRDLAARHPDLSLVSGGPELFPLAFGAFPAEEKLIEHVNRCLKWLEARGYFRHAWRTLPLWNVDPDTGSVRPS